MRLSKFVAFQNKVGNPNATACFRTPSRDALSTSELDRVFNKITRNAFQQLKFVLLPSSASTVIQTVGIPSKSSGSYPILKKYMCMVS